MLTCPWCREQALEQMRYGLVCSNCTYSHREGTSFPHEDIAIIWPPGAKGPEDLEERLADIEFRLDAAGHRSMRLTPKERDDIEQLKGRVIHLENQLLKYLSRPRKPKGEY